MAEHGRGVDQVAVRPGEQFGGFEKDRGAFLPGKFRPGLFGFHRRGNGGFDFILAALIVLPQFERVIVRRGDLDRIADTHFFPADNHGDIEFFVFQSIERLGQFFPFRGAGSICINRFIDWNRDFIVTHYLLHKG